MTARAEFAGYQPVGPREYLDRLLAEYRLTAADVAGAITCWTPPSTGGNPGPPEYLIRESLLRPHEPFRCAGDSEAREFCLSIAAEIVLIAGIAMEEAIERINQHWAGPARREQDPRIWIVGLDIAYHEDPGYWARVILEQTRKHAHPENGAGS